MITKMGKSQNSEIGHILWSHFVCGYTQTTTNRTGFTVRTVCNKIYALIFQFLYQLSLNRLHILIFQFLLLARQNKPLFLTSIWLRNDMEMDMVDHLTLQNTSVSSYAVSWYEQRELVPDEHYVRYSARYYNPLPDHLEQQRSSLQLQVFL